MQFLHAFRFIFWRWIQVPIVSRLVNRELFQNGSQNRYGGTPNLDVFGQGTHWEGFVVLSKNIEVLPSSCRAMKVTNNRIPLSEDEWKWHCWRLDAHAEAGEMAIARVPSQKLRFRALFSPNGSFMATWGISTFSTLVDFYISHTWFPDVISQ